ncbi:MAG: two-component system sensor histidine kinase NtrB, partial [Macromonas sp.]
MKKTTIPATPPVPEALLQRWQAFDWLATLVAVLDRRGCVLFVNTALEDTLSISRRTLAGVPLADCLADAVPLRNALSTASAQGDTSVIRYDTQLLRPQHDPLAVHVVVAPTDTADTVLVELVPVEQHVRLEREERLLDQAQANKELIRNLAHEIKNPLGGLRGAAQLLQMELESPELIEYTQVIIHEADRLQTLVDRLLAPHRRARVVGDVNIHEVCERVRALILAEFPRGLTVVRDYDTSLPE